MRKRFHRLLDKMLFDYRTFFSISLPRFSSAIATIDNVCMVKQSCYLIGYHNIRIPTANAPAATTAPANPFVKWFPSPVNGTDVPIVVPFVVPLLPALL